MIVSHNISPIYKILAIAGLLAFFAAFSIPAADASYLYPDAPVTNNNNNTISNNNVNTNTNTVTINVPQHQSSPQYYPPAPQPYPYPYPQPQPQPISNCFDGIDNDAIDGVDQADYGCQAGRDNEFINRPATTGAVLGTQASIIYVTAAPAAQTYIAQTAVITGPLRIFNVRVFNDQEQNVIVAFETNKPANGFVRYGLASEFEKTGNFTYPFTSQSTGGVTGFATLHQINLGKLGLNQTYFLRAFATAGLPAVVSTVAGAETAFSVELAFVQLPAGVQVIGGTTGPVTSASVLGTTGAFFLSPWFFLLLILALVVAIILALRRRSVVSTTGPIEINS